MVVKHRYSLIIFDYDGTICDTRAAIIYSLQKTFKTLAQISPSKAEISRVIGQGMGLEETLRALGAAEHHCDISQWVTVYRRIYLEEGEECAQPFQGMPEVLAALSRAAVPLILVSNKGRQAIEASLKRFALRDTFQLLVGGDSELKKKPDPMIFQRRIRPQFPQISLQEILMVGDTVADLQFAANINVDVCWAAYGYGGKEACLKENPVFTIDQPDKLLSLILSR